MNSQIFQIINGYLSIRSACILKTVSKDAYYYIKPKNYSHQLKKLKINDISIINMIINVDIDSVNLYQKNDDFHEIYHFYKFLKRFRYCFDNILVWNPYHWNTYLSYFIYKYIVYEHIDTDEFLEQYKKYIPKHIIQLIGNLYYQKQKITTYDCYNIINNNKEIIDYNNIADLYADYSTD